MKKVLVLATKSDDAKILLWCLREAGHVSYVVGNISKNAELEYSPLCAKFYRIPEKWTIEQRSAEIIDHIQPIIKDNAIDVIMPTGFESVKYLSLYKDTLNKIVKVVPVPSLAVIDKLGNKFNFFNFCNENNILHPKSYLLEDVNAVRNEEIPVRFPLLTKPLLMSAGRGIYKFENKEDLMRYLGEKTRQREDNMLPLLLQEFIPGADINFNGFAYHGRLCAWTIQQFLKIPRTGDKALRWSQFSENKDVLQIGKMIIEITKYTGPINIDLRIDERDQQIYIIEINPRFWAGTFISLCDGVNFADVAIQLVFDAQYTKEPKYSNRIWGSPHRLLPLIIKYRKKEYIDYARRHTALQIRYFLLNQWFSIVRKSKEKSRSWSTKLMSKTEKVKKSVQAAVAYRRDYGRLNLMLKLFLKFCPFLTYYETILYTLNLQSNHTPQIHPKLDITIVPLSEKNHNFIISTKQAGDPDLIKKRLELGERCFIAKHHDQICCYQWVAPGEREIEHEAEILHIQKYQFYFHDAFTLEQFRGKNLIPYLKEQVCIQLKNEGFKEAVSIVYNDNYSSRRSIEKVGFKKSELIRHFVIPFIKKKFYVRKVIIRR